MFKKLLLILFLFFSSSITIYPSKKENTNLFDYCYSLEKILARNLLKKSKKVPKKYKNLAKDITFYGTNKTKGVLVNKIVDQYKISKNLLIINIVPNRFYCFTGYWIEVVNPGTFESILFEESKQRINQYKDIKMEVEELIKDINSEYRFIKKEINNLL